MKEYSFTEKRIEGFYKSLDVGKEESYEHYEIEIQMDSLTRDEVDQIREFIREMANYGNL